MMLKYGVGDQTAEAEVIQVIQVKFSRGNGQDSPVRSVTRYFTLDGRLLAEVDMMPDEGGNAEARIP